MSKNEAKDAKPKFGFQSASAEDAAKAPEEVIENIENPPEAKVQPEPPPPAVVVSAEAADMTKMVRVRLRQNLTNVRIGQDRYTFEKNKEVLVPKFVKVHLEEKGLL